MRHNLKHLSTFVAVAEELNFHRAAERLRMAQPAVSRIVLELEERLGVKLLERTTRRVRLTESGRYLLEEAQAIIAPRRGRGEYRAAARLGHQGDPPRRLHHDLRPCAGARHRPRVPPAPTRGPAGVDLPDLAGPARSHPPGRDRPRLHRGPFPEFRDRVAARRPAPADGAAAAGSSARGQGRDHRSPTSPARAW